MAENTTEIKPYSKGELCNLYSVSYYTFNTWLKPHIAKIGEYLGGRYTVLQIKIIFEVLGEP